MKAGRLIELLQKVSHDAEVMCYISTDDLTQLTNMPLVDIEALEKYRIFAVLGADDNDEYCRLLIKKTSYQENECL